MLNSAGSGQTFVSHVSHAYTGSIPNGYDYNATASGGGADGGGGGNNGGGGRYPIDEWSSFIGITTSIAGNILISFALNIQRYAHIRIEREWAQRRSWWKKGLAERRNANANGRQSTSTYGAVGNGDEDRDDEEEGSDEQRYTRRRREGSSGEDDEEEDEDDGTSDTDRLQRSLLSDQTLTSFEKDSPGTERKSYLKSPYWWAGIILMTTGEAGNFLAYGFAPASIVSPLGVVALVSNCLIAPFMLKERFRVRDFWGVVVAVAGAVTVVMSAKTSENKMGPEDIWGMITRWEFELYLGLTAALIVGLMWASGKYGKKTSLIDLGLVGLFGGYTALSTKGVSSLLSYTLWHVITFGITYALVAVLVLSALMQIRYLNRALQRFDSTQVIPTQFVLFTLSVIIGSAVLYRDFESTTGAQAGKFVGGCALTFAGVYLITSGRAPVVEESELDEEEALSLLREESLHARPQWGPDRDIPGKKRDLTPERQKRRERSLPRSLLDDDSEDENESIHTTRVRSSLSPASRLHSISIASLSSSQQDANCPSSPSAPQSLTENPWLPYEDQHPVTTTAALAQVSHPELSSRTREGHPPAPSVLLRFPSAPGVAETPPRGEADSVPTSPYQPTPTIEEPRRGPTQRHTTAPHTPPSLSRNRNSISKRFAPKPLIAPLSSGLNAIVAESLRRRGSGEFSIPSRRESATLGRSTKGKRRIYTDELEAGDGADESAIAATPTPGEYDDEYDIIRANRRSTPGRVPAGNNTALLSTGSPSSRRQQQSMYAVEDPSIPDPGSTLAEASMTRTVVGPDAEHVRKHHRVRSLSDSWRDGIAWLSNIGVDEREKRKREMQKETETAEETEPDSSGGGGDGGGDRRRQSEDEG
ncbi:hypothetical protein FQN54_007610 [Arachnomyces sp. PD_36]|nr:hypothetical protein FQN54_007610 [Arachnomyces sp. PD_36]